MKREPVWVRIQQEPTPGDWRAAGLVFAILVVISVVCAALGAPQ